MAGSALISGYWERYERLSRSFFKDIANIKGMEQCVKMLKASKNTDRRIYVIGNGGSAAVAEHAAIDLTKNAGLKAMAISGSAVLTTYANDFGYENMFKKFIEAFGKKGDILIAISGSGNSINILNACRTAKKMGITMVTLSGFKQGNPLRKLGKVNFWVDSEAFGYLEMIHGFILHYINDSIIGSETYMIR